MALTSNQTPCKCPLTCLAPRPGVPLPEVQAYTIILSSGEEPKQCLVDEC